MKLNSVAASVFRVLDKCSVDIQQAGAWRWQVLVQNGTRLPLEASLDEDFLQLAARPEPAARSVAELEHALLGNAAIPGGAGLAMDANSHCLHTRAEIALPSDANPDHEYLLHRIQWAIDGFHRGVGLLRSLDSRRTDVVTLAPVPAPRLGELLRESQWKCEERGPNEFAAVLDADTEPVSKIRMTGQGLLLNVELVRADASAVSTRFALAVFLLTTGSTLRMARAYAVEIGSSLGFGFRVYLSARPEPEEIHHALAALSIAHRGAAREARVLLDEAAARCYLAARDIPTAN